VTGRTITLVTVAVLLMATGCAAPTRRPPSAAGSAASRSPSPSSTSPDNWDVSQMPNPCRVISLAEVTAVVADPTAGGIRLDSWPPLCAFNVIGPPPLEYIYVSDDARTAAKDDFDQSRGASTTSETVDGIGDRAYWLPDSTALHVLSGGVHLTVKFAGPRPLPDPKSKAIALAQIALPRAKSTS
jgi:hypothetical protein